MKDRMKLLTDEQVQFIHNKALDMLEELGMKFENDEACDYWAKAGATVEDHVCKIPRDILLKALETVPKKDDFVLYGRTPDRDWKVQDHLPTLHSMTMAVKVIDPETDEVRLATREDLAKLTRILERCDCYTAASAPITPQDVPLSSADWYTTAESVKNTTKHITIGAVGKKGVYDSAEMGAIALGGTLEDFKKRPFISVWALTSPPLCAQENMCNTLMAAAELGMCNVITSGGILGMSSPMTVESALIHTHAEIMATIALTQLVNPGAPVIYSSFVRAVDMGTMVVGMGAPESTLMRGCMAQMGNFLGFPTQTPTMLRDGKILDAQAGFETGFCGLVGSMTSDFIIANQLDSDLIVDFADIPFTNECMEQIQRLLRPLDFEDEERVDADFENMEEVGYGGSFLDSYHTVQYFRTELWKPHLTERDNYDNWVANGSKSIRQKALELAMQYVEEAGGKPLLTDEQCAAIDKIADDSVGKSVRTHQD